MVEGQGGKERCSFRTRAGAILCIWWKNKVEKKGVLYEHAEQKFCIEEGKNGLRLAHVSGSKIAG